MKTVLLQVLSILIFMNMEAVAQKTEWKIDPSHTSMNFAISHFMIATVKGSFDTFEGTLKSDGEDFAKGKLEVTIQSKSINTNQNDRDQHLRSEDFFGVEKNPQITFKSTRFEKIGDNQYKVHGILTMNGISKEQTINATYKGSFEHPQFKKTIAVFDVSADIPRLEFKVGEDYPGAALGEIVKLNSSVELTKL